MSILSEEKSPLLSQDGSVKLRRAKVLFSENKVEEYIKNEKQEHCHLDNENPRREQKPSLWAFLNVELTRGYLLEHDEERYSARREKVYFFMRIPREVEKFMLYGFMQCTDSFLFVYTFLPLRFMLAIWAFLTRLIAKCFGLQRRKNILMPAEICDLLKATVVITCSMMMFYIDTNMMYHLIKSQSVIKLYIFYNMLEVADRLFSAFGQDTIDALFWTATEPRDRKREHFGVLPHLIFAIAYVFLHSLLVLFQATTLNVAINSNNKALLTIMMSNNFVELKGSVFKKFDKNNLFQLSCSDVRERFHLSMLLFVVVLQTMKEYSWKIENFWVLLPDCLVVLIAEIFVDWIKHAFITRFNDLHLDVYHDYTTSLAYDTAQTRQKNAFSDHSDLVARRMGFIPLPLAVVMIRVLAQSVHVNDIASFIIIILVYFYLATLRIANGILLLGMASDLITQHKQEKASVASPSAHRANSPILTGKIPKEPTASPVVFQPTKVTSVFVNGRVKDQRECGDPDCQLGSTAIFSNSTVDLKNVSLNDELLKVGDEVPVEQGGIQVDIVSRSEPNINSDFAEEVSDLEREPTDVSIKKRSDSEPSLIICNEIDNINK